jgi:hypothetical protein
MTAMRQWTMASWVFVVVAGALALGCATGPSTLVTLREARATLEEARRAEDPTAGPRIEEAQAALDYAEREYQISPRHPLSNVRAEDALAKARAAVKSTAAARRTQLAVH